MKILFLVPYPLKQSPSQRFRFEQYFKILSQHGHQYKVQSFLNDQSWNALYRNGKTLLKTSALLGGFLKRLGVLFLAPSYDFVFIHREAAPVGPPIIEWIIAVVLRKKIIYDFDDAIWTTDQLNENTVLKIIRWRSKVASICRWSYKISCGNQYLCDYAARFNKTVVLNPTTIDTENLHQEDLYPEIKKEADLITLGWTGSHSTIKYLLLLEPVLQLLEQKFPNLRLIVIADKPPTLKLKTLIFKPWSVNSEIQDMLAFDIGIMPLPDDEWSKGKCGFKALQYMALKIPAVVSPVGVNTTIIQEGVNGYCCTTNDQWIEKLGRLIEDGSARKLLGTNGRVTVKTHYSVVSNTPNFLALFA